MADGYNIELISIADASAKMPAELKTVEVLHTMMGNYNALVTANTRTNANNNREYLDLERQFRTKNAGSDVVSTRTALHTHILSGAMQPALHYNGRVLGVGTGFSVQGNVVGGKKMIEPLTRDAWATRVDGNNQQRPMPKGEVEGLIDGLLNDLVKSGDSPYSFDHIWSCVLRNYSAVTMATHRGGNLINNVNAVMIHAESLYSAVMEHKLAVANNSRIYVRIKQEHWHLSGDVALLLMSGGANLQSNPVAGAGHFLFGQSGQWANMAEIVLVNVGGGAANLQLANAHGTNANAVGAFNQGGIEQIAFYQQALHLLIGNFPSHDSMCYAVLDYASRAYPFRDFDQGGAGNALIPNPAQGPVDALLRPDEVQAGHEGLAYSIFAPGLAREAEIKSAERWLPIFDGVVQVDGSGIALSICMECVMHATCLALGVPACTFAANTPLYGNQELMAAHVALAANAGQMFRNAGPGFELNQFGSGFKAIMGTCYGIEVPDSIIMSVGGKRNLPVGSHILADCPLQPARIVNSCSPAMLEGLFVQDNPKRVSGLETMPLRVIHGVPRQTFRECVILKSEDAFSVDQNGWHIKCVVDGPQLGLQALSLSPMLVAQPGHWSLKSSTSEGSLSSSDSSGNSSRLIEREWPSNTFPMRRVLWMSRFQGEPGGNLRVGGEFHSTPILSCAPHSEGDLVVSINNRQRIFDWQHIDTIKLGYAYIVLNSLPSLSMSSVVTRNVIGAPGFNLIKRPRVADVRNEGGDGPNVEGSHGGN